jgi:hypothetical protein
MPGSIMQRFEPLAATVTGILSFIAPTISNAQSLTLQGFTGRAVTVGADELKSMAHRTVTAKVHGLAGAYSGVPLSLLLAKINAPQGEALHGPAVADVVIVKACDGYRVVLTLPEIDPAFRDGTVILADGVDGHALDSNEGPFRLVVEGDKRAARSARCVTSLTLSTVP